MLVQTPFADHLARPLARGHTPEGAFTGAAGGAACGDLVRVSLALDAASPDAAIRDAGFDASGCGASVAAGSAAVALVRGAPLLEAARVGAQEIAAALGGLHPAKQHAAELAADALHRALGAAARAWGGALAAPGDNGPSTTAAEDRLPSAPSDGRSLAEPPDDWPVASAGGRPLPAPADGRPRTLVAMSGGVDSAVAALLTARAGEHVVGVTLELWSDPENDASRSCCSADAVRAARALAHRQGLSHLSLDLRSEFRAGVVDPWLAAHAAGNTPNPCLRCNGNVRLDAMLDLATRLGAGTLVTGHYARVHDATPAGRGEALHGVPEGGHGAGVPDGAIPSERVSEAAVRLTEGGGGAGVPDGAIPSERVSEAAVRLTEGGGGAGVPDGAIPSERVSEAAVRLTEGGGGATARRSRGDGEATAQFNAPGEETNARVLAGDGPLLRVARDPIKDQSYVLAGLDPGSLARLRFPLGAMTKDEVRAFAADAGLEVAHKPDSQDLCFLAGTRLPRFLERHAPRPSAAVRAGRGSGASAARTGTGVNGAGATDTVRRGAGVSVAGAADGDMSNADAGPDMGGGTAGDILDRAGRRLGSHRGAHAYTVGQRHGLGLGGGEPLYVLRTDPRANTVTVGPREALLTDTIAIRDVSLRRPGALIDAVKIRSRGRRHPCQPRDTPGPGRHAAVEVQLREPIERTAPGQVACLYAGDVILGYGTVAA